MTDALMDNFCNAQAFVNAMNHRVDTKITADTVKWLMEPCPIGGSEHCHQTNIHQGWQKGWSAKHREKYEYPISRLEFWSVAWSRSVRWRRTRRQLYGIRR